MSIGRILFGYARGTRNCKYAKTRTFKRKNEMGKCTSCMRKGTVVDVHDTSRRRSRGKNYEISAIYTYNNILITL